MSLELRLPESTTVSVLNHEGKLLIEADLIDLDRLLSESQQDIKTDEETVTKRQEWSEKFAALLSNEYGEEISASEAFLIASKISRQMRLLLGN